MHSRLLPTFLHVRKRGFNSQVRNHFESNRTHHCPQKQTSLHMESLTISTCSSTPPTYSYASYGIHKKKTDLTKQSKT